MGERGDGVMDGGAVSFGARSSRALRLGLHRRTAVRVHMGPPVYDPVTLCLYELKGAESRIATYRTKQYTRLSSKYEARSHHGGTFGCPAGATRSDVHIHSPAPGPHPDPPQPSRTGSAHGKVLSIVVGAVIICFVLIPFALT